MILFLYRLALELGEWNVEGPGGLADQIPWWQLERWMAAFRLMPWGDGWLRDSVLMAQQYNANRPKGKRPMQPWEFMPVPKREQTQQEMWQLLQRAKG